MVGIAVVAIPSQDDYVWKLSSEKVPHLTLLYLEGDALKNVDRVQEFIEHAVKMTLHKCYLSVERRGVLGDKSADVLFFNERSAKKFEEFRGYLLTNKDILNAYNAAEQYPSWMPHLTLGYPETPAKKDDRDYPGTYSIVFDRVALWLDDFEGPEFPLVDNAMYMSSIQRGEEFLAHYGIKGMKWGVHRSEIGSVATAGAEAVSRRPAKSQTADIVKSVRKAGGVRNIDDKKLETLLKRMDMESRYSKLEKQHKQELTKGRKATLKFLGEVGKIALPILLGSAVARAATSPGAFRTYATVGRATIDLGRQAIGS